MTPPHPPLRTPQAVERRRKPGIIKDTYAEFIQGTVNALKVQRAALAASASDPSAATSRDDAGDGL